MAPKRCLIFTFFSCLPLFNLVNGQDRSGFISLDCGLLPENSSYNEPMTGITYVSDSSYIDTGISKFVAPEFRANMMQNMWHVRSFPEETRNCYNVAVNSSTRFLIRASFMYGNYDSRNEIPEFDLYLGPNKWDTVKLDSSSKNESKEMIHFVSSESLQVCLVNTGRGTPFISALELRPFQNSSYVAQSGSLQLFARLDFGSATNQTVRYPNDVFDRIWLPYNPDGSMRLSTSSNIPSGNTNAFQISSIVMKTAATPANASHSLDFSWSPDDPTLEFYIYFFFAELQELKSNQKREFVASLNGKPFFGPFSPDYLQTSVVYTIVPLIDQSYQFSFRETRNSTLPPIVNAVEIYFANQLPLSPTDQNDLTAILNIKSAYGVKRNWEGDTCMPQAYLWDGVNCSYLGTGLPRIIALNLSSARLTGEIVRDISRLTQLQILDLSNNNLSGRVPSFLSQLESLRVLNLANNQLTGPIPSELMDRTKKDMSLSISGNPDLCSVNSCEISQKKEKKKTPSFVVPLVASIAGLCLLVATSSILFLCIFMRKTKQGPVPIDHQTMTASSGPSLRRRDTASSYSSLQRIETRVTDNELYQVAPDSKEFEPANRKFTYSQIINITNGFETEIGKGSQGRNYVGYLDDKEVTVKMFSSSSSLGYKQLKAEVKHLFRIHHRNLIPLLGYCNEAGKMALVYEHMANGNLKQHLSESSTTVFSREDRLGIALDVAQGLEYLHSGCKPSIIHRNVKCTNIFLDEKFIAKLGGFGLSRALDAEEGTHVPTAVAGTPGYVDPEYYTSNILTEKSDVYGFGVVLLEIITGKPAIMTSQQRMHISQWVGSLLSSENIEGILDPKLCGDYDPDSAAKTIDVAMACVSETSNTRPVMSEIVKALKESLAAEVARKESMQLESTDSIEGLALGFGNNPTPRLR